MPADQSSYFRPTLLHFERNDVEDCALRSSIAFEVFFGAVPPCGRVALYLAAPDDRSTEPAVRSRPIRVTIAPPAHDGKR
jgi:hypothetical protein